MNARSPGGVSSGASLARQSELFSGCCRSIIPVQPFADIVADYPRHDGKKKR